MPEQARGEDEDPVVEVIEIEERESRTRVRSARRPALDLDAHERPTVVPAEPASVESLEARVLFESRAAMERRYAIATQQDLYATRKLDAVALDEPIHVSVAPIEVERRRAIVRVFALLIMLAIVSVIALVVFWRA